MKPWVSRARSLCAASVLVIALGPAVGAPAAVTVKSVDQLLKALSQARPGTRIELASGEYNLNGPVVLTARGTQQAPVLVRAAQTGTARLVGKGSLQIRDSEWLTIRGLVLKHAAQTLDVSRSNNVRLTRLKIAYTTSPAVTAGRHIPWVRFRDGTGHRLDHSEIGPHTGGLGVTVEIDNDTRNVRIDHNYFHDRPRDGRNGAETIRVGSGGGATVNATIDNNLFENCDGESEMVSIKSNGVVVRGNTFRNNAGQLVVRAGDDILVAENQFINDDRRKQSGGIRVHGANIRVTGNYFQDISTPILSSGPGRKRTKTGAAAAPVAATAMQAGDGGGSGGEDNSESGESSAGAYWQAVNVEFTDNLIVDSDAAEGNDAGTKRQQPVIQLAPKRKTGPAPDEAPPEGWTIDNNVFVTAGPMVDTPDERDFKWQRNTAWRKNGGTDVGRNLDPTQLQQKDPAVQRSGAGWRMSAARGGTQQKVPRGGQLPPPLTKDNAGLNADAGDNDDR
jgi:poly(beta-D-mannuronate) lyase